MAASWFFKLLGETIGPITQYELLEAVRDGKVVEDTLVRKGESGDWIQAFDVRGLFVAPDSTADGSSSQHEEGDFVSEAVRDMEARHAENENRRKREASRRRNFRVSTCGPPPGQRYVILDTVFALDSDGKAGVFFSKDGDANVAFQRGKQRLADRAYELGADAVIATQFEYRVAVTENKAMFDEHARVIELFAYGTAI